MIRIRTIEPITIVVKNALFVIASKLPNRIWYKSVVVFIKLIIIIPEAKKAVKLIPIAASGFVFTTRCDITDKNTCDHTSYKCAYKHWNTK